MTIDTIGDVKVSIPIFLKKSINLLDNISTDLLVIRSDFNIGGIWDFLIGCLSHQTLLIILHLILLTFLHWQHPHVLRGHF